jgi:hypothetical protein
MVPGTPSGSSSTGAPSFPSGPQMGQPCPWSEQGSSSISGSVPTSSWFVIYIPQHESKRSAAGASCHTPRRPNVSWQFCVVHTCECVVMILSIPQFRVICYP